LANIGSLPPGDPFEGVNSRVDQVVSQSASRLVELRILLILMFVVGIGVLVFGFWKNNPYLIGLAIGVDGLMCWPVIRLELLYRRTIALRVIPQITGLLSPRDASKELCALIEHLLEKK
jgi:hypothetical protein